MRRYGLVPEHDGLVTVPPLRITPEQATYPGPGQRSCWLRGRLHQWGPKRGWFNGLHWFKVCRVCVAKRITYHVACGEHAFGPR